MSPIAPVLPHEDRAAYLALLANYRADFTPTTAHQEFLVEEMAGARWKIDRAAHIENALLSSIIDAPSDTPMTPESKIAEAMSSKSGDALARLERHRAALERTYHRAARELRAARKFQNEANSTEIAEKKFGKLVLAMADAPPPGIEARPKLVPIAPAPPPVPGPRIPNTIEEWKRNCQYSLTNPALRL